ncbi:MAG: hypothetical protein JNL40_04615 [Cyclobacteriaceae bacterium]|nr:hypothetical protein [Cyclobacteriaceae bacterium]
METLALTFNMVHLLLHQMAIHYGNYSRGVTTARRLTYSLIWGPVLGFPLLAIRASSSALEGIALIFLGSLLCLELIACRHAGRGLNLLLPGRLAADSLPHPCIAMAALTSICLAITSIHFIRL